MGVLMGKGEKTYNSAGHFPGERPQQGSGIGEKRDKYLRMKEETTSVSQFFIELCIISFSIKKQTVANSMFNLELDPK